jgi:anhydro-N-acetylmuramic acid kinase
VHLARRQQADKYDILASMGDAVAILIHDSIKQNLADKNLDGIYLTGGGRRNLFIVERLQRRCGAVGVWPIEALGYDGDLLEAISFAVLAGCFAFGIPSTLPQITGGRAGGIAGNLSMPSKPRKIYSFERS